MKVLSLLNPFTAVAKRIKGRRLIMALAIVTILFIGTVPAAVYTMNLKKTEHPVAEKMQNHPTAPVIKAEPQPSVAEEKPTVSSTTPLTAPRSTAFTPNGVTPKPVTKQITTPKPHTSEDPAFVTCTQKFSELYVKYNADIASINAEKNDALATIDELYNSGYYDDTYPGDTEPYNQWQIDRAEVAAHYNDRLADLNSAYATNSSAYLNC